MQFTTPIPIVKSNYPIDYNSRIVSIGSCFAVNINEKLEYYKFRNMVNPLGILFHPGAIAKLVDFAVTAREFTEQDVFFHNECWHSFDAHSDLNSLSKEDLLYSLNSQVSLFRDQINQASHVIITLGTAWVYRNIESGMLVANCHKVPQKQFKKELLSIASVKSSLEQIIAQITTANKNCTIIFTVSPVRHIKDGFVENQVSKSHLITAVYDLVNNDNDKIAYFPSYEIMMDELRDYRFYSEDMLHPNKTAIDYIWHKFSQANISEAGLKTIELVDSIQKGLAHRPFNPDSAQHAKFLAHLQDKIIAVRNEFPHIYF